MNFDNQRLKELIKILVSETSEKYFDTLVLNLSKFIDMKYLFIGLLNASNSTISIQSFAINGNLSNNFTFNLETSPCKKVISTGLYFYSKNIQSLYKKDSLLADFNIQTFLGYPLKKSNGETIGVMVFLNEENTAPATEENNSHLELISLIVSSEVTRQLDRNTLKENQERLDLALSVNNDGIFDWDLTTNKVIYDERYYTMAGYTPNEFPAEFNEWVSRLHPDDTEQIIHQVEGFIKGDLPIYDVNFRFKKKDNTWIWIRARIKIFGKDKNGHPLRIVGTHTDISQQKRAEEELKQKDERFRNFFNLGLVGMAITSTDKSWIDFNQTLHEMFGYTKEEFSKLNWDKITHPDDLNRDHEQFQKVINNETDRYSLEKRFLKKNGEIVHTVISSNAVKSNDNQVEYFVSLVHDITSRKLAEMEVKKTAENLRVTLNSIGDAVITTDRSGNITSMNPIALTLTKWHLDDAIGKPLSEIFHIVNALTREIADNPVEKVLESGEIVGLANHTVLVSKESDEYHIADSGAPILTETGEIIGVVLVFRDISEEYSLQEQLRHSQKMDAIGQLAGGIAHDFNNMLGAILMASGQVKKRILDNERALRSLDLIVESAKHAANLTQKLLTFSRKQEFKTKPLDLHSILSDTASLLNNTIDKKIRIHKKFEASPSVVLGDASQLQSAFLNVGINAVHAMPNGGDLTFETKIINLDEEYCKLHLSKLTPGLYLKTDVTDTGTGIEPEIITRIFEPFYTTKAQGKGTGLGLAAVYGTVHQHSGAIIVQSEVGAGSTFTTFLPLSTEHIKLSYIENKIAENGKGTILVVDDEPVLRLTSCETLEDLGYKVILAEDGVKALSIFKTDFKTIDLVILDMVMPHMNGAECLQEMKKILPEIKIIITTGYTKEDEFQKVINQGVVDFLKKPYTSNDLGLSVQMALAKQ